MVKSKMDVGDRGTLGTGEHQQELCQGPREGSGATKQAFRAFLLTVFLGPHSQDLEHICAAV